MATNSGKNFENCFKESVTSTCWIYRLRDNASSFAGGENTRFTSSNICDYIMLDDTSRTFYLLELKSTQGSITYWKKEFEDEDKDKKQSFMVKRNQIEGLSDASKHNLIAGFVFNFRNKDNKTYFMYIGDFLKMTNEIDKKSFNNDDVESYGGILIESTLKRVNYKYDIDKFVKDVNINTRNKKV